MRYEDFLRWLDLHVERTFERMPETCALAAFFNESCPCGTRHCVGWCGIYGEQGLCHGFSPLEHALVSLVTKSLPARYSGRVLFNLLR